VDGHKIIKFKGEKVGAQLLVVGHDRNMPNGGGGNIGGGDKGGYANRPSLMIGRHCNSHY